MRFGSVCSGIEAASVAWHPLGWRASFLSEIEAFPRAVLSHHFPTVPLHGDFTTIEAGQYDPIDLLVGGTPCQSFSVAGLRGGLADERGNLALEYLRLAQRLRPKWLVWENVPGVLSSFTCPQPPGDLEEGEEWEADETSDFGSFLSGLSELGYGFAYRVLDAQYFGLAQRRRRVFVVGCLGDWRRAAAVLFERHSLQGHPAPSREAGAGSAVSPTLRAGGNRTGGDRPPGTDVDTAESLIPIAFQASQSGMRMGGDVHPTLDSNTGSRRHHGALIGSAVRRLTPTECERLQGFPDGWTNVPYRGKPAADGPRYKALGNSMAVPVMAWIGRRIEMVEALSQPAAVAAE